MANYDAQINILVGGINRINDLENRLSRIQDTIEEINGMGAEGIFGRSTDLGVYNRALREINATADAVRRQTTEQQQANTAVRDQLLLYSRLNREQNLYRRRSAAFTEESRGVRETNARVIELTTQLRSAQKAFSALFADADIQGIRVVNTEIAALLEELREINRMATGTKSVGANTAQLQAQADGWAAQIRALRGRASALQENEEILARLAVAERNLIGLRNGDMTFREEANVRLGKQELANATSLIKAEENLASMRRRDAADYEKQLNRQSTQIKSIMQLASKALKAAGSATLDAVTFGKGAQVARGARNAAIRGGIGLGALGVGGAYAATQQALGSVDLGPLQGPAVHAASAIGGAINNAFGGLPGIIGGVLSALGDIPGALGLASVAALAFAPAMKTAGEAVYLAGKKFGESKFGENIKLTLDRQTNIFESVINKASEMNMALDASKSGLDAVGQAVRSLPALPAAGQTSFAGPLRQIADTATLRAIEEAKARGEGLAGGPALTFMGGGARPQLKNAQFLVSATGQIASRTEDAAAMSLRFAENLAQASAEAKTIADYLNQAKELRTAVIETPTQGFIRKTIERGRRIKENQTSADIARERSAALLGGQYSLSQVPVRGELFPGGRTETRQPDYRQMVNAQAAIRQYVADILQTMSKQQDVAATLEQLERRTLGNVSEGVAARRSALNVMRSEEITQQRINDENERSIAIIRARNKELRQRPIAQMTPQERGVLLSEGGGLRLREGNILDPASLRADRFRRIKAGRARQEAIGRATSEGLIGGAFPLLFGQGLGASIGGGLGGAAGGFAGGGLGFGLSLVGTALGTAFDTLVQAAKDTGKALRDPITGFEDLKKANLLASKSQEYYIEKLIEVGKVGQASAIIQGEIIRKIGTTGVRDLNSLSRASDDLSKAWAEFNLQLQAALAGPMAGLLRWVTGIVSVFNQSGQVGSQIKTLREGLSAEQRAQFDKEWNQAAVRPYKTTQEQMAQEQAIIAKWSEKAVIKTPGVELSLQEQEKATKASQQAADDIKSAYREAFSLQQQAIDLQRQGADLQRRVAQEIFDRQQEIQRKQIDLDQKRAQVAIATVDLEYQRRIANEEGRVAQALAAEAEYMKVKAEGEANIEAKKRTLELDIAKQKRDTENYIYQLNREIDGIRRATLNYEMQVSDYRRENERRIEEARKRNAIEIAAASGAAAPGTAPGRVGPVPVSGRNYANVGGFMNGREMLHGIPGYVGKDPKHSTEKNIHYHFAGKNPAETKAVADFLKNTFGYKITEFGQYGQRVGGHSAGSQHYRENGYNAFDIGGASLGGPTREIIANMKILHKRINDFLVSRGGSVIPQYQRAESQIKRPEVPMVGVSGVAGQRAALDAQGAAIDRQALSLEEQLNNLREAEALEKLMQAARGPKDIQRRQNAVNLAKAELGVISAVSDEEQQRLLFEAQSKQLIDETAAENKRLLDTTKLTGDLKSKLSKELDKNLAQTQQQIELDRELLKIAQERAFSERAAALDKEKAMFGTGFRAGYYGQAAQEYQAELARSGNEEQARLLAEKRKAIMEAPGGKLIPAFDEAITQLKELATWENVAVTGAASIGDAFGQAFRDISSGTMTAKEVLANFFQNMADRFSDMAGSMIADLIKIAFYKQIAQWMNIPLGAAGGTMGGIGGGAAAGLSDLPSAITSIAPVAANGAYFSNGIAAFARGGVVNSPTLFRFADGGAMNTGVMGEAGPEAILPLKRGSDGKLGVSGGDGGGVNVTVNVDASGSKVQGDDANAGRLGQAVAAAVREEIVRQKRPGGLL